MVSCRAGISPDGQVKMWDTMPAAVSKHQKYFLQSLGFG